MKLIRQQDPAGCALACIAMATRHSYETVKRWFPLSDFVNYGITHHDIEDYLGDHGFRFARKYRWLPGRDPKTLKQPERKLWPPQPFAPVHIIGINDGRHDVVWLPDGTVLDPNHEEPRHITQVGNVAFVIGVWPDDAEQLIADILELYDDDEACAKECPDCHDLVMCDFHSVVSLLARRTMTHAALEREWRQANDSASTEAHTRRTADLHAGQENSNQRQQARTAQN
jgi:hypothetical protein